MAKRQFIHVRNLEKYLPSYRDRALSWVRLYCRDAYDKKTGTRYQCILDDQEIEKLDEVNRWRFVSLILREAYLGRPVPLDEKNVRAMGWDLKICSKSRTVRVLHKFVVSVTQKAVFCDIEKEKEKEKDKEKDKEKEGQSAPLAADWLAPDFPLRFASALRLLIVPKTKGDQTTQENIGRWVQEQIRAGADPQTLTRAVVDRADKAKRNGHPPMRLLLHLLRDELGYPQKGKR